MSKNVLITGGAGFIGSYLTDELIKTGYNVRILDNLCKQVHGSERKPPSYLNPGAEFFEGNICDKALVKEALRGVDVVYHLAAAVGVGQSMYKVQHYTKINNLGTARLIEAITERPVEKLIVASSMSIYGEGSYCNAEGTIFQQCARKLKDLKRHHWDLYDDYGRTLEPIAVKEDKIPDLQSVYALSKYDQEKLCLIMGSAYGIPTTALRFFNVYGSRQALSNPYTGVLAIFASRLMHEKPPLVFEDGNQKRDFIHVRDVARACRLAMESSASDGEAINIGSGNHYSINHLGEELARVMGKTHIRPFVTDKYRVGDIRHCFADITKACQLLDFTPEISLQEGMEELSGWLKEQISEDHSVEASNELAARGLTI